MGPALGKGVRVSDTPAQSWSHYCSTIPMTHNDRSGASPEHTAAADAQCTAASSASAENAADRVAANGPHQEARIRDESAAPRAQAHAASATVEQGATDDAAKGAPQDEHVPVEAAACRAHSEPAPPVTAFALANGAADFIAMPHVRAPDAAAAAQAEIAADVSAGIIQGPAGAEVRVPHADAGVLDAPPPPRAQRPQSPLHAHGAAGEVIGPPVVATVHRRHTSAQIHTNNPTPACTRKVVSPLQSPGA
jgi:hypothetical protein